MNKTFIIGCTDMEFVDTVLNILKSNLPPEQVESVEIMVMPRAVLNANLNAMKQDPAEEKLKQEQELQRVNEYRELILNEAMQYEEVLRNQIKHGYFNINQFYNVSKQSHEETKKVVQAFLSFEFIKRDSVNHNKVMFTISYEDKIRYYTTQYLNSQLIALDIEDRIKQLVSLNGSYPEGIPTLEEIKKSIEPTETPIFNLESIDGKQTEQPNI